jgi:hypothetical protein
MKINADVKNKMLRIVFGKGRYYINEEIEGGVII